MPFVCHVDEEVPASADSTACAGRATNNEVNKAVTATTTDVKMARTRTDAPWALRLWKPHRVNECDKRNVTASRHGKASSP